MSPIRKQDIRLTRSAGDQDSSRSAIGRSLALVAGYRVRADRQTTDMAQGVRTG